MGFFCPWSVDCKLLTYQIWHELFDFCNEYVNDLRKLYDYFTVTWSVTWDIISCSFVVVTEIFKLKTKYFAFYVYQTSVFWKLLQLWVWSSMSVKFFALATYTHTTHPLQAANSFFVGLSPHILTHFQVRFTIKLGKSKPFKVQFGSNLLDETLETRNVLSQIDVIQ